MSILLFSSSIRSESHAFLDGLLPPPYSIWSVPTDRAAFDAGMALSGQYPEAECREEAEIGTGLVLYTVHSGAASPRVRTQDEVLFDEAIHERARRLAEERALLEAIDAAEHAARIESLKVKLRQLKGG